MTWNEFDLELQAITDELAACGDFASVKYELPRSAGLTGRLHSTIYLEHINSCPGHQFKIPVIEVGELSCTNICIELAPGADDISRRLFFDLENLYRVLFHQAAGMVIAAPEAGK